jgi:hypothetical protein
MNNTQRLFCVVLAILLALVAPLASADEHEVSNGMRYEITWTDIDPDMKFVLKGDTFRLLFTSKDGRKVELKPLPPLRGRWGQGENYKAVLSVNSQNKWLYCGDLEIRNKPHPLAETHANDEPTEEDFNHPLSISVVDPNFVILDFQECKYHESHGGLAHAHTSD